MSGAAGKLTLDRGAGTSCTVDLFGASIISWIVNGEEKLFVGGNTVYDNKTPLVGGVPIVFPKFADWGEKPFHGFARICLWEIEQGPKKSGNGDVIARFILKDTPCTRKIWNHGFSLVHEVILGENKLESHVYVTNPSSSEAFDFDLLLHTYVKLPDVTKIAITGFQGSNYVDKTKNFQEFAVKGDVITVRQYTDNIYKSTSSCHVLSNTMSGKSIKIGKTNYPDTVVWNPWLDTVKNFPELKGDDFKHFVCVEAGHVAKPKHLAPGETYKASQVMEVV